MSDDNRQFAYGANEFEGCDCPAIAAGLQCSFLEDVAEQYDTIVMRQTHEYGGTIDEETAKEAWLSAIDFLEERKRRTGTDYSEKLLSNARQVARELGWLEADDE
jgi:hypothetical protein